VLNFVKYYTIKRSAKDPIISVTMKRDMMSGPYKGLAVVTVDGEENPDGQRGVEGST